MGMSASMWENLEVEAKEAEPGLLQSRDVESLLLPFPSLNNRSSYGNSAGAFCLPDGSHWSSALSPLSCGPS